MVEENSVNSEREDGLNTERKQIYKKTYNFGSPSWSLEEGIDNRV